MKSEDLMAIGKSMGFDLIEHRDRMVQLNNAHAAAEEARAAAEG